ncbi:MAG TPA: hypothetical protein VF543_22445 [Pyrinomonadaceae bacterium]|jgi:hypothetical protein
MDPFNFADLDFDKAFNILLARNSIEAEKNFKFFRGDHLQDFDTWTGPQITDDEIGAVVKKGIARDFTSKNPTRSGVKRHIRGVLGREPGWIITTRRTLGKTKNDKGEEVDAEPNADEQKRIKEANEHILQWWNHCRALLAFREAATNFRVGGRGPLRLYTPPGRLKKTTDGRTVLPVLKPEEAIKHIFLIAPKFEAATVVTDPETMKKASIFLYTTTDGKQRIEVSFIDDEGFTVFRVLEQGGATFTARVIDAAAKVANRFFLGTGKKENEWRYEMDGKLFVFEMNGEPLITEQVRQNQSLVAKGLTMLSHNMDMSGFRERVYLNAQPPGRKIVIDDPENPSKKVEAFIGGILPRGAGSEKWVRGVSYTDTDKDGKKATKVLTPDIFESEPLETKSFEDTARIGTVNIYEEMDQLHVTINGDATATGESRKQARDDYQKSLNETAPEVDYVGSEVLEGFLALFSILIGKPGRYADLRVAFKCVIDPGPLSAEDRRLLLEERKAKVRSREDHMEQIGINDPDAMKRKIQEEEAEEENAGKSDKPEKEDPPGGDE